MEYLSQPYREIRAFAHPPDVEEATETDIPLDFDYSKKMFHIHEALYEENPRSESTVLGPWFDKACYPTHEYIHSVLEKVDATLARSPRRPIETIVHEICVQERWPELMYQTPPPRITKPIYGKFLRDQDWELANVVAQTFLKYYVEDGKCSGPGLPKIEVRMKCSLGPPESVPKWFPWRSENDLLVLSNRINEKVRRLLEEDREAKFWIYKYGPEVQNDGNTDIWVDWYIVLFN